MLGRFGLMVYFNLEIMLSSYQMKNNGDAVVDTFQ